MNELNEFTKWKLIFGFSILVLLACIAIVVALGRVEEQTSHGLMPLITALATLSGSFANWAFRSDGENKSNKTNNE